MPRIAKTFLRNFLISLLVVLAASCQVIPGLFTTYAPTPTFPPFPQPSPTVAATQTSAPSPMIVSKQNQEDSAGRYTIKLNYPSLEGATDPRFQLFNTEVDKIVSQVTQDFKNNVQQIDATPNPNSTGSYLSMEYSVKFGERGLLSVLFTVDYYMAGAAHPNQYFVTLNLDVARGKVLALKDLFKPGADYLKYVSDFAIQDLNRQARLDWDTGATPKEENFRSWNVTPGGLLLSFDPYQVTAYAAGPQTVIIPYNSMKDIVDPEGPLAPFLQ